MYLKVRYLKHTLTLKVKFCFQWLINVGVQLLILTNMLQDKQICTSLFTFDLEGTEGHILFPVVAHVYCICQNQIPMTNSLQDIMI